MNFKRCRTILFLSIVFIVNTINTSTICGQIDKKDVFYYIQDSCLMQFNTQNDSIKLIYKKKKGIEILAFINNWKQGKIILIQDSTHSFILRINKLSPLNVDTIYSLYKTEGEGYQSISNINISPTGDFMVLFMAYWESPGIRLFDFRNDSILESVGDKIYLTHFIKWLPFNSILAAQAYGSEMFGLGDLLVYNINLENHLFKTWTIPKTLYEGFHEGHEGITILTTPENSLDRKPQGLRLNGNDLIEVTDTNKISSLLIAMNWKAKIKSVNKTSFSLELLKLNDNELIFNKHYELEYSHFDWFEYKSMDYDPLTKSLILSFEVSMIINKNARENYGYVLYYINLSGQLLKKVYNNVSEYRAGFSVERYEHIYESKRCLIKKYINGKYVTSFESHKFISPIPREIIIK